MKNKYRLSSGAFKREEEEDRVDVDKIFFLSVEGNVTEPAYFKGISDYRESLGMNARVDVEVLRRGSKDTKSAPSQVIELLEECVYLCRLGRENFIQEDIPKGFVEKYGVEFIETYLDNPEKLPRRQRNAFQTDLMKIGYNINYRRYFNTYNRELDEFCVLIDKYEKSHSEVNMLDCIRYCREKGYKCYIVNPCFEFWLLLHLSDVEEEYKDKLEMIKENPIISSKHTFVSKEVLKKASYGKGMIDFERNYLPNVELAIQRAKKMESGEEELVDNIGCNLWKLLEEMKK